jgi:hypothetical protein
MDNVETASVGKPPSRPSEIRRLNDEFRRCLSRGRLLVTRGVHALPEFDIRKLVEAIASYDDFNEDNDPYEEHDFGSLELLGAKLLWKIDYYDVALDRGSPDPANPAVTVRVLTVMLPSEY